MPAKIKKEKKSKIKLLIIDLYGVMTMGSYRDTCRWIANKYKLDFNTLYKIVYHKWFDAAAVGKISELQSFAGPIKELGLKETPKGLRAKHLSFQRLNKSVFKYITNLQSQGYQVLLLSKNTPYQFNWIVRRLSLKKYFKYIINTYDLRLSKSSSKTIKYVLNKFKVKPAEAMMVDDQDFNLTEPAKLGVHTILYKNFKQFKKELDKLLR